MTMIGELVGGVFPRGACADTEPAQDWRTVLSEASGESIAETVRQLRVLGSGRTEALDAAAGCRGNSRAFWDLVRHAAMRRQDEERMRWLAGVLRDAGPVGLAQVPHDAVRGLVKAPKACEAMASWRGESLLVLGGTGIGKTAMCAWLVASTHASAKRWSPGATVEWASGESLLLSQRRHPLGQGEPPEYERATRADLLVVDDPDWIRTRDADDLFALVCAARERRSMPILVTSGATFDEFRGRYGSAVVRRIIESSRDEHGKRTGRIVDCHEGANGQG